MSLSPSANHLPTARQIIAAASLIALLLLGSAAGKYLGRPPLPSLARPEEIERGPRGGHLLTLTFDAGGETTGISQLLAALASAHSHCTFFLTGRWAALHPELAEQIHRAGHEIGNHTWSHPDLTKLTDDQIRIELLRADATLRHLLGHSPRPLWRAPYGAQDSRVLRVAMSLGYTSIYWTLDSLDSVGDRKTSSYIVNRILNSSDDQLDGAIILMHVGELETAEALPIVIAGLQRRHFTLVNVSQLTSLPQTTSYILEQPDVCASIGSTLSSWKAVAEGFFSVAHEHDF